MTAPGAPAAAAQAAQGTPATWVDVTTVSTGTAPDGGAGIVPLAFSNSFMQTGQTPLTYLCRCSPGSGVDREGGVGWGAPAVARAGAIKPRPSRAGAIRV